MILPKEGASILEPEIAGPRISGGFRYHDAISSAALSQGLPLRLRQGPGFVPAGRESIILDSLWWYLHPEVLDILHALLRQRHWGIIFHAEPPNPGFWEEAGKAAFVITSSAWSAELLRSRLAPAQDGGPGIEILYPGWDGQTVREGRRLAQRDIQKGKKDLVFFTSANWQESKGHLLAARVLARLAALRPDLNWTWRCAGKLDPSEVHRLRRALGPWAGRLIILGQLDAGLMADELARRPVCVQLSRAETFSLAVYEALLLGCPLLGLSVGGVPEARNLASLIVGNSGNCLLMKMDREELLELTLAQALKGLIRQETSPDPLPELDQAHALQYSWEARAQKLFKGTGDQPLSGENPFS